MKEETKMKEDVTFDEPHKKGLEMKYFVIKPRAKSNDDVYAHASREAMKAYADAIEVEDPALALELREWRKAELCEFNTIYGM